MVFEEKMFGNFFMKFFRAKSEICVELKETNKDDDNNEDENSDEEEYNDEEEDNNNKKDRFSGRPSSSFEMNMLKSENKRMKFI